MKYIVINDSKDPMILIGEQDIRYFDAPDVKPGDILLIGTKAHVFGTRRGAQNAIDRTEAYAREHDWAAREYYIVPVED